MSTERMSNRSLGEQLQAFYNCILLSPEEAAQRQLAIDRLTELVLETLPNASVHLVGSSASGIASKNSSVDLTVEVAKENAEAPTEAGAEAAPGAAQVDSAEPDATRLGRERADLILSVLRRREGEFVRVQVMHSRQVSVVTCVYRQADLRCSVRLGSCGSHRRAAALLNGLSSLSEAFRLLTVVTREWALSRQLIRRKGALTGYAVALLVLFHMEQGGLVPPSVVRALARGHRKSEVSEALRKWQPEPLSTEQLGEQFCGLVRLYATIGFFASSAVCVLTGRLLDRGGRDDPFPGARVSLPCPVSGENVGRTYSRVSEPEEPFFRTALNLAKDHDLFTACFTRNLDGMRKAKLVQQLPAFRRLEEQNLVPPMQRLVERVQRTLQNRGRSGYEKFAGRLAAAASGNEAAPNNSSPPQQQKQQPQYHQQQQPQYRQQRQQQAGVPAAPRFRASSSPKQLVRPQPLAFYREIPRPPRPVLRLPRSCSGGGRAKVSRSKSGDRPALAQAQKKPRSKRGGRHANKPRSKSEVAASKSAKAEAASEQPAEAVKEEAIEKPTEEAQKVAEGIVKAAKPVAEVAAESVVEVKPSVPSSTSAEVKRATFASIAAKSMSASASAAPDSADRRPLAVNNRADCQPAASSQSLPQQQRQASQKPQQSSSANGPRSYARAVSGSR